MRYYLLRQLTIRLLNLKIIIICLTLLIKNSSKIARKSILASLKEKETAPLPPLPPEAYQNITSNYSLARDEHHHGFESFGSQSDNPEKQEFRQPTLRKSPILNRPKLLQLMLCLAVLSLLVLQLQIKINDLLKEKVIVLNRKRNKYHEGVSTVTKVEAQSFDHMNKMAESPISPESVPLLKRNESVKQTTLKLQKQLESLTPIQIQTVSQQVGKVAKTSGNSGHLQLVKRVT